MTENEFRRLMEQARVEARRASITRREAAARDVYEARGRHAEFGACAH